MVFFDLRTSRSYITAHRPAESAQMKSGYSFGPRDVTKVEHYARRVSAKLSRDFGRRNAQATLKQRWLLWSKDCPKVKTCRFGKVQLFWEGHKNLRHPPAILGREFPAILWFQGYPKKFSFRFSWVFFPNFHYFVLSFAKILEIYYSPVTKNYVHSKSKILKIFSKYR